MDPVETTTTMGMSPEMLKFYVDLAKPLIVGGALAILILIVGWTVSKWANRWTINALDKAKVDQALSRFLGSIAQYTVLAAAVIAALGRVGVETTSLVAIFASAGLAVGLALQGSLGNFASGVMILFFKPFQLGDVITAGGETGKVVDIGLFASTMHTPNNLTIILPNSAITGGTIVNITALGTRRMQVDVGVGYGEDIEKVRGLLLETASKCKFVLDDPGPAVAFTEMGASSINFVVHVWCKAEDFLDVIDEVRTASYTMLNEQGIDIPYDQVVMHTAPAA